MSNRPTIAVIGAGPAGLMAAEVLSAGGAAVTVYDRMPSAGRKLLMAGRGGLNLTHSEPFEQFVARYGTAAATLRPILEAFPPSALIAWANGLGAETFVGSSGRVFPKAMKASPLLRGLARTPERPRRRVPPASRLARLEGTARCSSVQPKARVAGRAGRDGARARRRKLAAPRRRGRLDVDPSRTKASFSRRSGPRIAASQSPGAPSSANASPASP